MSRGLLILLFLSALSTQAKEICIGKSAKIFQERYQLNILAVDGVSSRRSTFWYKGNFSKLKLDFDTANVIATCKSAGTDVFKLTYSINGRSEIKNQVVGVTCKHCVKSSITKLKTKLVKLGEKLREIKNPERQQKIREQMLKLAKKLHKEIEKELKKEKLPEEVREELETTKKVLEKVIGHLLEGDIESELFHYYLNHL